MHRMAPAAGFFAIFLLIAAGAQAQPLLSAESTRGIALGTGVRASGVSGSALAYSAASMPIGRLYHVDATGGYEAAVDRWTASAAAIDSSNPISAGLLLAGIWGEDQSGLDGRLALAFPLAPAMAIGITGRYISLVSSDQDAPPLARGLTIDLSLRVSVAAGLHLAALGYNLVDIESPYAPRMAGGSASYTAGEVLTIGGDCLVDFSTYERPAAIAGGGIEYLASGRVPLRLGYRYEHGVRTHALSGGIGWIDDKVGLEFGIRQGIVGSSDTTMMATVRYFVR